MEINRQTDAALIQATIAAHLARDAQVRMVTPRPGPQGYSGAVIGYYDVTYSAAGGEHHAALVIKPAPLVERRTLQWLGALQAAVPFSHTLDLTTDAPHPICMQYAGAQIGWHERTQETAEALASIHAAGMRRGAELSWVPHADRAMLEPFLIERCWRQGWQSLLADGPFIQFDGQHLDPHAPTHAFSEQFARYTEPIERRAEQLLAMADELWELGEALTLIHGDFHNEQVGLLGETVRVIDWGFAHYGPLYLDLPNVFTREEALIYRGALAAHGHNIPHDRFLACYDAMRAYPGFKYFGIGLYNWCFGDPPRQPQYVQHFIDLIV
jgi:Phosphotransferase enzyme family